jgi:hypothetical protein
LRLQAVFTWCVDSLAADDTNMVTKLKDYLKVQGSKNDERYPDGVLPGGFDRMQPPKKINHLRKCMRFWVDHVRENLISQVTLLKIVRHVWMAEIKENPTWHDAARVAQMLEELMDPLLTVLRHPDVFHGFEERHTSYRQRKTQTVHAWIQGATETAAPLLGFVDEHDLVRKIVNGLHKEFQAAVPVLYEALCKFARVDTQEAALTAQQKGAITLRALRELLDTRAHRAMIVTGKRAMGIVADDHEAEKKRSTKDRHRSPDGDKDGKSDKPRPQRGGAKRRGKGGKSGDKDSNSSKGTKRKCSDATEKKKAGGGADGNRKKHIKCYNCQKMGHYADECRLPKKPRPDDDASKDDDSRKAKDQRKRKDNSVEKAQPAPTYTKEEVKKKRDEFRAHRAGV